MLVLGVIPGTTESTQAAPATNAASFVSSTPGTIAAQTVPDGTCRVGVAARGGTGASSGLSSTTGGRGGASSVVNATYSVLPGQSVTGAVGGGGTLSVGGVGGGGDPGTIPSGGGHRGGGGGGRTDVSIAAIQVVVAGGGGGGGAGHNPNGAGNGGSAGIISGPGVVAAGENGWAGVGSNNPQGGQGGQTAAGGTGGTSTVASFNGSPGIGTPTGDGGDGGPDIGFDSGGGGGAGYTGGGGGSSTANDTVTGAGGGGGSSWAHPTSPTPSATPATASGSSGGSNAPGSAVGPTGTITLDWQPCIYDLALTKSVASSPVMAGGTVVWTISVRNNGPDPMTKGDTVDLTDSLPAGPNGPATPAFKVLSVATSGGANADMASGPVTCTGVTVGSSLPASTTCSRPYSAVSAPGAPSGGQRGLNVGETLTITYEQQISAAAPCGSTITNRITGTDRPSQSGTTDVIGNVVTDVIDAPLTILCAPKLRLQKALDGVRHSASDQFTVSISPSGAAPTGASATSTGTGATVSGGTGVAEVSAGTAGTTYNFTEAMAPGSASALSQYSSTVSCVNANTGSATVLPVAGSSAVPFSITPTNSDNITCTLTNKKLTSSLKIDKSTATLSVSGLPALIPYKFTVTNNGQVTLNSIMLSDPMVTGVSCLATTLAPAAVTTCTGTHAVTQADLDAGSIVNTATVTGTPPGGTPIPQVSSNPVTVPVVQSPSMSIQKSSPTPSYNTVGQSIAYSFLVKNTGNVTLSSVAVSDPVAGPVSCPAATLAAGTSMTCSAARTVTQDDLNAGAVINTASVVGTPPGGVALPATRSNTVRVPAVINGALTISKASSTPAFSAVGETINYDIVVRNSGNVTMSAIAVTDTNATTLSCPATSLAAGASMTCSATHQVAQTDLDAGSVVNTASVVGTPPGGTPIAPVSSNPVTVPGTQRPTLTIKKSSTSTSYASLGQSIPYSFLVKNTGNVTLSAVTVTDPVAAPISCAPSVLAPNASVTCTGSHTVTQADLDRGSIVNTAQVVATPPSGTPLSPVTSNTVTIPAAQSPAVTVEKSSTSTSYASVGQSIPYSFLVKNTGNVTLTSVSVTDAGVAVSCPATTLAPGATTTCTGTRTVTQADLDRGSIVNTARVVGTPPSGTPLNPVTSNTVTIPADQRPALSIVKSTTTPAYSAAGQTIAYRFVVTNTGNVALSSVAVSDPTLGVVSCALSTLAPKGSTVCTGSRPTTAADVANGKIENTASVIGTPPTGPAIPPVGSNKVTIPLTPLPSLTITKSTPTAAFAAVGDQISYSFLVRNTGNVALSALTVTDPSATALSCPVAALAIGESTTCTATHIVTQADLNAGSVINTAAAAARPPTGPALTPVPSNTVTVSATQSPALTIAKAARPASIGAVGEIISYSFTVRNAGNVDLTAVVVSDPTAADITCPVNDLAAGSEMTCSAKHNVTQADLDGGSVINTASVVGTAPSGKPTTPALSNTVTVPARQSAVLRIKKSTTTASIDEIGDVISYKFVVQNTGNVTISSISVSDPNVAGLSCPASTLAPGTPMTCTAVHVATLADLNAGEVVNTASVVGRQPSGTTLLPAASNTVVVPALRAPSLSIVKATTTTSYDSPSDTLAYSFTVVNDGNVTITDVAVSDPLVSTIICTPSKLDPSQQAKCTGNRVTSQADVDAGAVVNTASVTGTGPDGAAVPLVSSNTVTVPAVQQPTLTIVKSADLLSYSSVGQDISYRFVVTNTGNVTLTSVSVSDPIVGPVSCPTATLAPGAAVTCTKHYFVTQTDLDAGGVVNSATAGARAPSGAIAPVGSNTVTIPAVQKPGLTIAKSASVNTYDALDESIAYAFVVRNNGNVTISGVVVGDPHVAGVTCVTTKLAPGASTTCTGTRIVTRGDLDVGQIVNIATVTGTDPTGAALTPVASNAVTVTAEQRPALTIVKSAPTSSYDSVDDAITYSFTVSNTGNVTMSDIVVSDGQVAGVQCAASSLTPGQSTTCTGTHAISQADIDAGKVVNVASVTGLPPQGGAIPSVSSNTVTVTAQQLPGLTITKSSTTTSITRVNQVVRYEFVVTNTGNVTLTGVSVDDASLTGVACAASVLAPGQATKCAGNHTVTQADMDSGKIVNTASVVGTPASGVALPPAPSNIVTIPADQQPGLTLVKAPVESSFDSAGDLVRYEFVVTNSGNVTIAGITINDPKLANIICVPTVLVTGQQARCAGTHVAELADVNAGSIVNVASVSGTVPGGGSLPAVASNTVTVPAVLLPDITISKSTTATEFDAVGDRIPYAFVVTNTGNVTLSAIAVDDPVVGQVACPATTLDPAATMDCTGEHVVTQADLDAGRVVNTASVGAETPTGGFVPRQFSATVTVPAVMRPSLRAKKTSSVSVATRSGDVIGYDVVVTNTGNVSMSLIEVTDALAPGMNCPTTVLAPREQTRCTGSHTVTQAEVDAGSVTNIAQVTGRPPIGEPLPPERSNPVTVNIAAAPKLSIEKQTSVQKVAAVGDRIDYTFVVANTGNVTMTSIEVTDPQVSGLTCLASSLAPGRATTCTGTHIVTLADLDAGAVVNIAQVVGTPPSGNPIAPTDSNNVTVPATQTPSVLVVKTTTTATAAVVGQSIAYEFEVTNNGNVTLTDVRVSDPKVVDLVCPQTILAPGTSMLCAATHEVTQEDLDALTVVNQATVVATPPGGQPPLPPVKSNIVTVPVAVGPAITIDKVTDATSFSAVGEVIPYQLRVTNTGNVTLRDVRVSDPITGPVTCPVAVLAPTQSTVCTASHQVNQADIDAGGIVNVASVVGTSPTNETLAPVSSPTVRVPAIWQPNLELIKSARPTTVRRLGEVVSYQFGIRNTGNVTIDGLRITDPVVSGLVCAQTSLAPGASTVCSATRTATQADLDSGQIINTATVGGTTPDGSSIVPITSNTVTVSVEQSPALRVQKSTTQPSISSTSNVIEYTFVVTNFGNVSLSDVHVSDPIAAPVVCPRTMLVPGQQMVCTARHQVVLSDLDAGSVVNTATASGLTPLGQTYGPVRSNTVTVPAEIDAILRIEKAADGGVFDRVGQAVKYTFTVTNIGNVTLTDLRVSDPLTTPPVCLRTSLEPQGTTTCSAMHFVTREDLNQGQIRNTAGATARDPDSGLVGPVASNTVVVPLLQRPALTIVKSSTWARFTNEQQTIPFTFLVTNTGNVQLSEIVVSDPMTSGVSCPQSILEPAASMTCQATHLVTAEEFVTGDIVNIASVGGRTPTGATVALVQSNEVRVVREVVAPSVGPVPTEPSVTSVVVTTAPNSSSVPVVVAVPSTTRLTEFAISSVELTKRSLGQFRTIGDEVGYRFVVTNNGQTRLRNVKVQEHLAGVSPVECPGRELIPGQKMTCDATYVASAEDVERGYIDNSATVTADGPDGTVTAEASTRTTRGGLGVDGATGDRELAFTGFDPSVLAVLALLLFASGGALVVISIRRHRATSPR